MLRIRDALHFLGLRNITIILDTEKSIRKTNPDFDIEKVPLDDKATLKMMADGYTDGVFQFESEGMKNVLRQFVPENIEDIIAILSLYRPGPMDSIPKYIHNRHNPHDVVYAHPLLKPILEVTYGCIVYQEQVMQICRNLAGYSFGRADIVRRAMSKKKHDVMQKERNAFIFGETDKDGNLLCEGAVARGVPEAVANEIFDQMSAFASYAFNKGHAAAYAVISYRTAYLKCHYPSEYMAALFSGVLDSAGKVAQYTAECKRLGIKLLPPDVNKSMADFYGSGGNVRFGLLALKNIGSALIEKIITEREQNGTFTSMYDFCLRCSCRDFNRRALETLIKSGAMDSLEKTRKQMIYAVDTVLSAVENEKKYSAAGQFNLFDTVEEKHEFTLPYIEEMPKKELLRLEKEATGLYMSGHPMQEYRSYAEYIKAEKISDINVGKYPDGKRVTLVVILSSVKIKTLKNGQTIVYAVAEDLSGSVNVTAFNAVYLSSRHLLTENSIAVIKGRISEREDRPTEVVCDSLYAINDEILKSTPKKEKTVYIRVPSINAPVLGEIMKILENNTGNSDVFIYCEDTKKKLAPKNGLKINCNNDFIEKISEIVGNNNVKTVD